MERVVSDLTVESAMTGRARSEQLRLVVLVERKSPSLPRYAVVPSDAVQRWKLQGTTTVEGSVNGTDLGRRSLKPWDDDRWFIEFPADLAEAAGFETGDRVRLELRRASVRLPAELEMLLESEPRAREAWEGLTASRRRMLREHVLAAKRQETRVRRARRALLGSGGEESP